MINFLRRIIPRRIRSGSSKYPTPKDVYDTLISDLVELSESDKLYFRTRDYKKWVEVCFNRGDILVTIAFLYNDTLENIFTERGVVIPERWGIKQFKRKKKVVFRLASTQRDTISQFLDIVFKNLYENSEDYIVFGKTVLGCYQYG